MDDLVRGSRACEAANRPRAGVIASTGASEAALAKSIKIDKRRLTDLYTSTA